MTVDFDSGRRAAGRPLTAVMRGFGIATGALAMLLSPACRGPDWAAGQDTLAPARRVARALGDPMQLGLDEFDPGSIPRMEAPRHVRPCCSFGMDLRVRYQGVVVPGFVKGNVVSATDLGHHEYDHGFVSLSPDQPVDTEHNGLVYTCRGGFVDVAHVRDYADLTFFLGLRFAQALPRGSMVALPGDGAARIVTLLPVPEAVVVERGRFIVAAILAQWTVYQLSIWHEIASWYGVESVAGFSERVSAFSPEDLYSNALGIKIGAALVEESVPRTREDYNRAVDAWLPAVLERLGAVTTEDTRALLRTLDGKWWDSRKPVPDNELLLRRNVDISPPLAPWRAESGLAASEIPAVVTARCKEVGPVLPLHVPSALGQLRISDLVSVEIRPDSWVEKVDFPFPDPEKKVITPVEYPLIMKTIRAAMEKDLGAGFDRPDTKPAPPPT